MEEMDCDGVAQNGIFLITALGRAEERTMLVWRVRNGGGVEEDPLDEIYLKEEDIEDEQRSTRFRMKSGVVMSGDLEGEDGEWVILMYDLGGIARFKTITKKK
jgi:hypothetical protein